MRRWLLLTAVCVLCACRDDERAPTPAAPADDAGHGGAPGTGAGGDRSPQSVLDREGVRKTAEGLPRGAALPGSQLDRPADLPRPPGSRLPDDLKPPVR